jgi:rSAM/selenodomain-associated transferase 1
MGNMSPPVLIVMAKLPEPGRVKTRLCPPLTPRQAARLHTVFLRHTIERLASLVGDEQVMLCHTPDDAGPRFAETLGMRPRQGLLPQGEGDLGDRLTRAAVRYQAGPTLFFGADSPHMASDAVAEAIRLTMEGGTIGPCEDGGFWCVGLPAGADAGALFAGVDWSSGRELQQVRERAGRVGVRLQDAAGGWDVDRPADLARLWAGPAATDLGLRVRIADAIGPDGVAWLAAATGSTVPR